MDINLEEIYENLPVIWQEWVDMWPIAVRENAILISVVAIYEDVPPQKVHKILNKHPEMSPIFSNLSYHSGGLDNKFIKKLLNYLPSRFRLTMIRNPKDLVSQYKKEILGNIFDLYFEYFSLLDLKISKLPPIAVLPYVREFFEYLIKFRNTNNISYIDKSIKILQIVYQNFSENTEVAIIAKSNIGYLYEKKTEILGHNSWNIMKAVEVYKSIINKFGKCDVNCALIKYKISDLLIKYRNFINIKQFESAKDYICDAIELISPDFPEWSMLKTNLGIYYSEKFKNTENLKYLEKSLKIFKEISNRKEEGSYSWSLARYNVGYTNLVFYKYTNFFDYLFDAIDSFHEVLDSSDKGTGIWINTKFFIGLSYLILFDEFENIEDLESGINHMWDVLVYEEPSSFRSILAKILIGMAFLVYFGETSDIAKLENALEFSRDVLKSTKNFPSEMRFFPKINVGIAEIFMEYFKNGKIDYNKLLTLIKSSMGKEAAKFFRNVVIEEFLNNPNSLINDKDVYLSLITMVRSSFPVILKELISNF